MTKRRVVITGMGAVTPYGVGVDTFWNALKAGKSGISISEQVDIEKHVVHISGEVKDFNAEDYIDPKEAKKMDRFIQFAVVAADEAIKDAKLEDLGDIDPYRVGVIVSSAAGGFKTFEDKAVVINQGNIYATQIVSATEGIQGRIVNRFNDVWYNTTENGLDDTIPT